MSKPKRSWKKIWALVLALAVVGSTVGQHAATVTAAEAGGASAEETPDTETEGKDGVESQPDGSAGSGENQPDSGTDGSESQPGGDNTQSGNSTTDDHTQPGSGTDDNGTTLPADGEGNGTPLSTDGEDDGTTLSADNGDEGTTLTEDTDSSGEEGSDESPVTIELDPVSIVPDASLLPDQDELFAGYVQQQMYAGFDYGISTFGNYGEGVLTGINLEIYQELKEQVQRAANGEITSTLFSIDTTQFTSQTSWTWAELGTDDNDPSAAASIAWTKSGIDLEKIIDCLLVDCPYELYWYEKSAEGAVEFTPDFSVYPQESVAIVSVVVAMVVADEYAPEDSTGSYTLDPTKVLAAQTAIQKAQAIVKDNQGKSDYEKLVAYKDAICDLVDYNTDAATNADTPYGNPWQLIWVFDEDASTNVVCEGYAKAFQYLCDLTTFNSSQIVCYTVTGTMSGGTGAGAHMWNVVTMDDGQNYLVDVTNSDAGTVGADGALVLAGLSGTWETTYTYDAGNNNTVTYAYDSDTRSMYGAAILTLASEKYTPPAFSVSASAEPGTVTYGYTEAPVLTAVLSNAGTAEASYQWYSVSESGDETAIQNATGLEYTVESGLGVGTHTYRVKVTIGTAVVSADTAVKVEKAEGSVNNNNTYSTSYTYNGSAIVEPSAGNFETNAGALTFTWYKESTSDTNKLESAPTNAGSYVLKVDAAETDTATAASLTVQVNISPKPVTVTAYAQTITYGEQISLSTANVSVADLIEGHTLYGITLAQNTTEVTENGIIQVADAKIQNSRSEDVTANYNITYVNGTLTISKAKPTVSFKEGFNPTKTYDGTPITFNPEDAVEVTGPGVSIDDVKFTWYYIDDELENAPTKAGLAYELVAELPATTNTEAATDSLDFIIDKIPLTITPDDQQITYGEDISKTVNDVTVTGTMAPGDFLTEVALEAVVDAGNPEYNYIRLSSWKIKNQNGEDVSSCYSVGIDSGKLTVYAAEYPEDELNKPTNLTATYGDTLSSVVLPEATEKGSWSWENGSQSVGNAGQNTFNAVFTPNDTNYKPVTVMLSVEVAKADPVISFKQSDVTYTFTNTAYPASENVQAITLKNDETFNGEIQYSYTENGGMEALGLPKEVGSYTVYASIAETENYNAAKASFTLTISYLADPETILYNGAGKRNYYCTSVDISASGYTVSETLEGEFTDRYTVTPAGTGAVSKYVYFKNSQGQITTLQTIELNFDLSAPTGSIGVGNTWWQNFLSVITFGKYKVQDQSVTIESVDNESGISGVQYYIYTGDAPYTSIEALEDAGDHITWTDYSDSQKPTLAVGQKSVVYAKIINNAGMCSYASSTGILIDNTAPVITGLTTGEVADTSAEITFIVDESCTYYVAIVDAASETTVTAEAIRDHLNGKTVTAYVYACMGTVEVENSSSSVTVTAEGLKPNTSYKAYVFADDLAKNLDDTSDSTGNVSELSSYDFTTAKADISGAAAGLTGDPVYLSELSVTIDWNNAELDPGAITYTWYRGETPIENATGATYTLTADDIGSSIRVEIKAENCEGTLKATSGTVQKAACPEAHTPTNGTVNDDPSADTFTFTGTAGVAYEYSLDGGATWKPVESIVPDEGTSTVTGTVSIGNYAYAAGKVQVRAAETDVYKAGEAISNNTAFTATLEGSVTLSGTLQYGETLTAKVTGAQSGAALTYSFYRSGETDAVQSGNESAYTLTVADVGQTISVTVTAEGYEGKLNSTTDSTVAKRALTITADAKTMIYGDAEPELTYNLTGSLAEGDSLSGALAREEGSDVGIYVISRGNLTVTHEGGYDINFIEANLTINPASYSANISDSNVDSEGRQIIIEGIGTFTEPTFTGVGNEEVAGTLSYSYGDQTGLSYGEVVAFLLMESNGAQGTINYNFVPDPQGNYRNTNAKGTISFIIKDVEFFVGEENATAANTVTVKENPVYGDSWAEILQLNSGLKAVAGTASDSDQTHFTLSVDAGDTPDAGEQGFTVYYNGTLNGKTYTNEVVCTGTVNIAKKTVTVSAGSYKVSKEYDGTTAVGTAAGSLSVEGILTADAGVTVIATPDNYNSPDVGGQSTLTAALALTGEGSSNYQLAANNIEVPCEITPKPITPTVSLEGSEGLTYNGEGHTPAVTVSYEENGVTKPVETKDYQTTYTDNVNAGTATVTVTPAEGGNYTWSEAATATFTIEKADYTGTKTAVTSAKYGNAAEYDLAALLPEGYVIGTPNVTSDEAQVLVGTPTVTGTKLSCLLADDESKVDKTATVTIPVTETKNYKAFDISVTIKVEAKLPQNLSFAAATLEKTYGDADFTNALSGAVQGSALTFTSSAPEVAAVDSTGKVHILKASETPVTITVGASATSEYAEGSAQYTFTVARKALAWDTSELTALDKENAITEKKATLSGSLKLTGILAADAADVTFTCPAEKLTGTWVNVAAGTQKVTLTWADAENPVTLQGSRADNYTIPAALPEITGTIHAVTTLPTPPESTASNQIKVEMESGISEVPEALADNTQLDSLAKIERELKLALQKKSSDVQLANMAVYDLELLVSADGGANWTEATADNFPAGGITVTIPYPAGTSKNSFNFVIANLFTANANGMKAGDIVYPTVTLTDDGIQFRIQAPAVISTGWTPVTQSSGGSTGSGNDGGSTSGGNGGGGSATVTTPTAAPTGDSSPIILYLSLALAAALGIGTVYVSGKRRKNR